MKLFKNSLLTVVFCTILMPFFYTTTYADYAVSVEFDGAACPTCAVDLQFGQYNPLDDATKYHYTVQYTGVESGQRYTVDFQNICGVVVFRDDVSGQNQYSNAVCLTLTDFIPQVQGTNLTDAPELPPDTSTITITVDGKLKQIQYTQ